METLIKNLNLDAKGLWLPITLSLILLFVALLMPKKKIGWRELYITIGVVGLVTWVVDGIFARFLDLVDFGDPIISGIGELVTYSFVPTSLAVIYLNYLNQTNKMEISNNIHTDFFFN